MASQQQHIYLLGNQSLADSLLCDFLSHSGLSSSTISSTEQVTPQQLLENEQNLFMVDYGLDNLDELISQVLTLQQQVSTKLITAVFNVSNKDAINTLAGSPTINGCFSNDCPQALLKKGIHAIFNGELWFPRNVLQDYMIKSRILHKPMTHNDASLTKREIEILHIVASGAKNVEIAKLLALSQHTVKTHIYNIFRKIGVSNRMQAVNWAKTHL